MSFFQDTKETVGRFQNHIDEFQDLFRRHRIAFGSPRHIWSFLTMIATDRAFHRDVVSLGNSVLKQEGGKVSLTALFTIIGVAIGGIGIAGMGSAVGLPAAALAALLGSIGFGVGQEIDTAISSTRPSKQHTARTTEPTEETQASENSNSLPDWLSASGRSPSIDQENESVYVVIGALQSLENALLSLTSDSEQRKLQLAEILRRLDVIDGDLRRLTTAEESLLKTIASDFADMRRSSDLQATLIESQTLAMKKLKVGAFILSAAMTVFVIALCILSVQIMRMTPIPAVIHR